MTEVQSEHRKSSLGTGAEWKSITQIAQGLRVTTYEKQMKEWEKATETTTKT